jgi:hypothetical protein
LILVQGERWGSSLFLICRCSAFPEAFVEEAVFSPLCVLGSFIEDQLAVDVWVYVWVFHSALLDLCLFLWQYHAVLIVMAL